MSVRLDDRTVAALLLGPVVLGGLISLVGLALEGGDVPADEDYVALAAAMDKTSFDPAQDRLVILPAWSLRPLVAFKRFPWISGDDLAQRPMHRVRDLYLVVEPDGEGALDAVQTVWAAPETIAASGPARLLKVSTGARTVVDDLAARLDQAQVQIVSSKETVPCDQRRGTGFGCKGRKGWQRVTRERLLVSENGQEVIWAHPPPKGERLELTWPATRLDDELVVRAGFTRTGSNWAKAPVRLRVAVGGEEVATLERPVAFDFAVDRVDTRRFKGRTLPVTLTIHTRDNGKAHFAFDLYTAAAKSAWPGDAS